MRKHPKPPLSFPALVQAFFVEHLTQQRALSPQTVAAYRDAFMLFLGFAEARLRRSPALITLADITPDLIMAFLDHLERERHNSVRSRNARLAALRSFLKFAAHRDVSSLQVIEHALGVPAKRFERPMLGYLSREEMLAVIGTPDGTWFSQRDHALLLLLYNTGARVSEIVVVKVGDVVLDDGAACVHLHGKGRKQRSVPLWRSTVRAIRAGAHPIPPIPMEASSGIFLDATARGAIKSPKSARLGMVWRVLTAERMKALVLLFLKAAIPSGNPMTVPRDTAEKDRVK